MKKFIIFLIIPIICFSQNFVKNNKINESAYSYKNLSELNNEKLRIARNTIFAYYGRSFQSDDLKRYFSKKRWYRINYNYNDNIISNSHKKLIDRVVLFENKSTYTEKSILSGSNILLPRKRTIIQKNIEDHLGFYNCSGKKKRTYVKKSNYTNKTLRNYAVGLVNSQNEGYINIGQVCDLFDHFYNNWTYVNDPNGQEYVASASETIKNNLYGDCDDFAVVLCSAIIAIGGEARIGNGCSSGQGCHAWAEVNIGNENTEEIIKYLSNRYGLSAENTIWWIKGHYDSNNRWLNLDWFASFPGGELFDVTHNGSWFYILQNHCIDFGWYEK